MFGEFRDSIQDHIARRLEDASATDLASLKYYTVKRGETLPVIARKLRVSKTDLAEANYLRVTSRVNAGQRLMVPHEATVLLAARTDRPVPATESRAIVAGPTLMAQEPANSNRVKVIYEVRQGDTLTEIASLFKTTVAALKTWNPRLLGSRLQAGARLTVYKLTT